MLKTFWTDCRKMFGDYHIYFCMLGIALIYTLVYSEALTANPYGEDLNTAYGIIEGNNIVLVSFLISIVGGSFLYCAEEKHGYLHFEIQRIGVSNFTISKLITSFLGGFCTIILGTLVYLSNAILILYMKNGHIHNIWFTLAELESITWQCLFEALRCGVLSAIGFLVTTYVTNYYIGMTVPILLYYAALQIEYWISVLFEGFPMELFFSKVYGAGIIIDGTERTEFIFAILYTACVFVVMYKMAKESIQRRLEHA